MEFARNAAGLLRAVLGGIVAFIIIVAVISTFLVASSIASLHNVPLGGGLSSQAAADQTSCLSNMRQLGVALAQYSQDWDQTWPGGSEHWAGATYPYVDSSSIYHCLADKRTGNRTLRVISYAMNSNLAAESLASLADPSRTVALTEFDGADLCNITRAERSSPQTTGIPANTAWGGVRMGTTWKIDLPTRHDPQLDFIACDGHAYRLCPDQVSSGTDNASPTGKQDLTHAAGTQALKTWPSLTSYMLTFSRI